MPAIFSSINGQKRSGLPASVAAVILMLILSLFSSRPDFVCAEDSKTTPDEQKVLQWLEELKAVAFGEARVELERWINRSSLGLETGPDLLMALYETGNPLPGVFFESYAKNDLPPYNGPGEAEKWAGINRANKVVSLLEPLAETNVEAMTFMAVIVGGGLAGHPQGGREETEKWSEKAAEAGDSELQHAFFVLSLTWPDQKWTRKPQYWLERIAESGNKFNFARIGDAYEMKYFLDTSTLKYNMDLPRPSKVEYMHILKNLFEAARWYRHGVEQGNADCQAGLAGLYERYGGVPGRGEAKILYEKAAENGHKHSRFWLDLYYSHGEQGPNSDHSKNLAYYRELAETGDPKGQFMLGVMYAGFYDEYPENQSEAVKWLEKAYEAGETGAASTLAYLYHTSIYPYPKRPSKPGTAELAEKWLWLAAENNDDWALKELLNVRERLK